MKSIKIYNMPYNCVFVVLKDNNYKSFDYKHLYEHIIINSLKSRYINDFYIEGWTTRTYMCVMITFLNKAIMLEEIIDAIVKINLDKNHFKVEQEILNDEYYWLFNGSYRTEISHGEFISYVNNSVNDLKFYYFESENSNDKKNTGQNKTRQMNLYSYDGIKQEMKEYLTREV